MNYLAYQRKLYLDHRGRDETCVVSEHMQLDNVTACTLCIAEGERKPWMLSLPVYILCHLLLFPAMPYRLWMAYETGKMKLELRKEIETDRSHLTTSE